MLQFAVAKNLNPINVPANQIRLAQSCFIHDRARLEIVQVAQIHDRITSCEKRRC